MLPMGWREVPVVGLPGDAGTPEDEWDTVAHPEHPRKEVRRWQRGNRYVRICIELDPEEEDQFSLRFGHLKLTNDSWRWMGKDFPELMMKAKVMMRKGGFE